MFVMGISGGYGQGKTLTGVIKAQQWAAASGAKLFSNFPMRDAYLFDHYTDWFRVADAHGSIIIFDEAQSNWDNRQWGGSGQVMMTKVMNFVRKMNCLFIFILPSFSSIDSRVREMTDIFIECVKSPLGTIQNYVYEFGAKEFGPKGKFLRRWTLPKASQQKVFNLKLYSTHSMVQRFPTPPAAKEDQFFKELDQRHNAALERTYGKEYLQIQTLAKEELLDVG